MAQPPGGHYRPEQRNFVKALVKAIAQNKTELGTKPSNTKNTGKSK